MAEAGAAAIRQARLDLVKSKLQKGTPVNFKDLRGRTMLHDAAIAGDEDVVTLLVSRGGGRQAH